MSENPYAASGVVAGEYMRARRELQVVRAGLAGARAAYLSGKIEVDEFEERVALCLRVDADPAVCVPFTDAPGAVLSYRPSRVGSLSAEQRAVMRAVLKKSRRAM